MKPKIILIASGLIIVAGIVALCWYLVPKIHLPKDVFKSAASTPGYYPITQVVDGDTIEVNMDGKIERIRLIGLDTPETKKPNSPVECYGQVASNYAHKILDGQKVRLEVDPINTNRDRYSRLLRYVYLLNGKMVNSEMIINGYGFAYLSYPFTKSDEFRKYQKQASEAKRGLWASGVCIIRDKNGLYKTNTL